MIKLLVIGNSFPHSTHTIRAANVVIFELLKSLVEDGKGHVGYQLVQRVTDPGQTEVEVNGQSELSALGVELLPPIRLPLARASRPLWKRVFKSRQTDFYPDSVNSDIVYKAINDFSPDVILVPWSEWLTALCADFPCKKFAYYGNPDHKSRRFRLLFDMRNGVGKVSKFRSAVTLKLLERRHLDVILKYDIIGNVASNDADYYRTMGHPKSLYLQNVWIDRVGLDWVNRREHAESNSRTFQILANIGQLGGTANRYGLELLGRDFAPKLEAKMDQIPYELNVYGAGSLIPSLELLLRRPEIRIRGFVEDIDLEILGSHVFLCLNNASPFKVGHTRYLHAWSLGACVVAHQDAALSMPEMKNNYNCLLGHDLDEISELVRRALLDAELRRRIGRAGYETFKDVFVSEAVSLKIWTEIETLELKK